MVVGRKVCVRPTICRGYRYWNLVWPRQKPKAGDVTALQKQAGKLRRKITTLLKSKTDGNGTAAEATPALNTEDTVYDQQ